VFKPPAHSGGEGTWRLWGVRRGSSRYRGANKARNLAPVLDAEEKRNLPGKKACTTLNNKGRY